MNVKNADTPAEALALVWQRDGGASHSPKCATRSLPFGHHYRAKRDFDNAISEFSESVKGVVHIESILEKSDEFLKKNNGKFSFSKRRGYMVLEFLP